MINENNDCINSLITRFNLKGHFVAYSREDLIGQFYYTSIFTEEQRRGDSPARYEWLKIEDAAELDHPHYIFDGIALKVKVPLHPRGWWIYGCWEKHLKREKPRCQPKYS